MARGKDGRRPGRERRSRPRLQIAGLGRRCGAYLIDGLVLCPVWLVLLRIAADRSATSGGSARFPAWVGVTVAIVAAAYAIGLTARYGQTLGKRALGIAVVEANDTGYYPSLRAASLRVVPLILAPWILISVVEVLSPPSARALALGWFIVFGGAVLLDVQRRGPHDRLARTIVVKKPRPQ